MVCNQMLKICGKLIFRPLQLIFNKCMLNGILPSERKKEEPLAYSQEKQQTMFRELPFCLVTASFLQNPRTFDI